jgi:hypothetical protein
MGRHFLPGLRIPAHPLPWPGVAFALGFAALIAAPHCYVYNGTLPIPFLAKFASFGGWPGRAALFGPSPLPFRRAEAAA